MKKIISLLIAAALVFAMVPAMAQNQPIKVMIDGRYIDFDVQPQLINDRTMVPVRAIFEALGANVDWDDATWTVISDKGDTKVTLAINDNILYKNGEGIELDVPAQLVDSRTLVPVRAISEAYGCWVDWNNELNTVIIVSNLNTAEVMNVGGQSVSAGYFNYCLYNMELIFAQSLGMSVEQVEQSWYSALGDVSVGKYISDMTTENISMIKAGKSTAKQKKLSLSDEELKQIEDSIATMKAEVGGEDVFKTVMELIGTTENDIKEYLTDIALMDKLYAVYSDELGMDEKQIKAYLDKNYIQAQHVLISTEGLTDKEKAEKRKLADQVYEFARQGMEFEKLVEQYGEDPGMEVSPEGYLFTKGEMVKEFEDIAFNLKVGKISGVVETAYGYHIIKRVENQYNKEIFEQVKAMLVEDSVNGMFDSLKDGVRIHINSGYVSNVAPVSVQ